MDINLAQHPELAEEFKMFLTEKRDRAMDEALRFDALLSQTTPKPFKVTPVATPEPVPTNEEILYEKKFLAVNAQESLEPLSAQEILNSVRTLLGATPFIVQGQLIEKLRSKGKRWQDLQPLEFNNALVPEIRSHNNTIRRFMVGEKAYTYALTTTPVPNRDVIFYNADAHKGGVVFNNMRNVVLKMALTIKGDFTHHDVAKLILKEMPYMKASHQKDFMDGASTTLGQLAKMGKLDSSGRYSTRTYRVK